MVNMEFIGMAAALTLSALGSGIGAGIASMAAVGGWKKCYVENKPAPFIMVAFAGAPLTQTIYGFLLMNFIANAIAGGIASTLALFVGVLGGLAICLSAYMQGKAAAAACDALAETGK